MPFNQTHFQVSFPSGLAAIALAVSAMGISQAQDLPPADPGEMPSGLALQPLSNGLFPPGGLELEDPPSLQGLDGSSPAPSTPSENVVINLINHLVAKGILSQGDAADLMIQAQRDAEVANQNAATAALVAEDMTLTKDEGRSS